MRGTLESFSIVELLQMLGKARHSGTLHLECPARLIDVRFANGRIGETRDSTRVASDTVLGSVLLRRALVDEAQLDGALREQERHPRPLGTILVERGALPERDLREVLSRQLANTLVAARVESSGSFLFAVDPEPKPVDYLTIDTQAVLLDISSVAGDYCLAVEVLGQADTVVVVNADYDTLPSGVLELGRDEFMVLALVDGRRTVREITEASGLEEVVVVSTLGKLCDAGVLLAQAEPEARAVGDGELRAHRDSVWAEVSALFDIALPEADAAVPAVDAESRASAGGQQPGPASGQPGLGSGEPGLADPAVGETTTSLEAAAPAEPAAPAGGLTARGPSSAPDDEIDWGVLTPE